MVERGRYRSDKSVKRGTGIKSDRNGVSRTRMGDRDIHTFVVDGTKGVAGAINTFRLRLTSDRTIWTGPSQTEKPVL